MVLAAQRSYPASLAGRWEFPGGKVEDGEEPDPLEKRMAPPSSPAEENKEPGGGFCPYCGAPAEKDYDFCRRCGKKLP